MVSYEMLCCIVNHEEASKALAIAREAGLRGGTICQGRGTVRSRLLELLDLNDERKEIVFMLAESQLAEKAADEIVKGMSFHKRNRGIAFRTPVRGIVGLGVDELKEANDVKGNMYDVIYTVVGKGLAEEVVSAANEAGAHGATIINARGAGAHETQTLFAMPIEPEKEIVMMLVEKELTPSIIASIRERVKVDEPGNGVLFVMRASKTYGLYTK